MLRRRAKNGLAPWLLAVMLLAVQALSFAHELQHDLKQHDDTSCVLHVHTKHVGHPSADVTLVVLAPTRDAAPETLSTERGAAPVLGYRTRAPPLSSVRSIHSN